MRLNLSVMINRPPGDVFEAFIKIPEWADRIPAISKIEMHTEGETVVGTKFTETRIMFGKEAQETMTVTRLEADSLFVVEARSHGSHYITTHRFTPSGTGTEVGVEFEAIPESLFAKIFGLVGFLFKGAMEKVFRKDLDALKDSMEGKAEGA